MDSNATLKMNCLRYEQLTLWTIIRPGRYRLLEFEIKTVLVVLHNNLDFLDFHVLTEALKTYDKQSCLHT